MSDTPLATTPKPFVFVLMPLDPRFKDAYTYGIKGAASDVGAYAERLDEQIFTEGMLDRIFNQISKADVIVADMTGRNPNVFYEVGYAHALGKIVLLVTQDASDIPFDLKHKQHIVYGGHIETLRKELSAKIRWAVAEAAHQRAGKRADMSVRVYNTLMREGAELETVPVIAGIAPGKSFNLPIFVRNEAPIGLLAISHVYLFTTSATLVVPRLDFSIPLQTSTVLSSRGFGWLDDAGVTVTPIHEETSSPLDWFDAHSEDASDGLVRQFQLPITFVGIPPRAVERQFLKLMFGGDDQSAVELFRLRLHTEARFYEFTFKLDIKIGTDDSREASDETDEEDRAAPQQDDNKL